MLYTLGDLHLSFSVKKPMDVFGGKWEGYVEKLKSGLGVLRDGDTIVLCGDISWAMSLEDALEDFKFINSFPGEKIILKGNHDYWWTSMKKMTEFFKNNGLDTLKLLHNNCYFYGDTAICGTRGWFFEEETGSEHDKKLIIRETGRLEASLKAAGDKEKICFLHYPPRYARYVSRETIEVLDRYDVKHCYYGHIHGYGHRSAVSGQVGKTFFNMVSADFVDFIPVAVKE